MIERFRFWLSNFFAIPKGQANGLIILLPLCFVIILAPRLYDYLSFEAEDNSIDASGLDSLITGMEAHVRLKEDERHENVSKKQFNEYSHGNNSQKARGYNDNKAVKESFPSDSFVKRESYRVTPFNINEVDTVALKKIRGIGSVLSARIVKYRDLLGGFVNTSQYREVYGLKDSIVWALDSLALIDEKFQPERININLVSEWGLSKHPYINKTQARALINYKNQHGDFKSLKELFKVKLLDSATVFRLSPYLNY